MGVPGCGSISQPCLRRPLKGSHPGLPTPSALRSQCPARDPHGTQGPSPVLPPGLCLCWLLEGGQPVWARSTPIGGCSPSLPSGPLLPWPPGPWSPYQRRLGYSAPGPLLSRGLWETPEGWRRAA